MNIFVLDANPLEAARFHNDRHVSKMILESAQILSTVHVKLDGIGLAYKRVGKDLLRPTHMNHPCVAWARAGSANYLWLQALMAALTEQYSARWGATHAYAGLAATLATLPRQLPLTASHTRWPQCMPMRYQGADPVLAYRRYYVAEKQHLATWSPPASVPEWWTDLSLILRIR